MAPQRFMTSKNATYSDVLSYYMGSYCLTSWKPISDFLPNFLQKSGPYFALVCFASGIVSDLTNLAHSIATLNGHEFEKTPGDSEGQGSLAYCSPWGHKESDTTYRLNSNNAPHCLLSI